MCKLANCWWIKVLEWIKTKGNHVTLPVVKCSFWDVCIKENVERGSQDTCLLSLLSTCQSLLPLSPLPKISMLKDVSTRDGPFRSSRYAQCALGLTTWLTTNTTVQTWAYYWHSSWHCTIESLPRRFSYWSHWWRQSNAWLIPYWRLYAFTRKPSMCILRKHYWHDYDVGCWYQSTSRQEPVYGCFPCRKVWADRGWISTTHRYEKRDKLYSMMLISPCFHRYCTCIQRAQQARTILKRSSRTNGSFWKAKWGSI